MTRDALQVEAADLGLAVEKISPAIGARIDGLDLREELSEDLVACLMSLLVEYKAIIIRDQDITTEQHVAFSRRFGELEVHPFAAYALKVQNKEGYPEVMRLHFNRDVRAVGAAVWHSDVTWRQEPSLGSVIRSLICPPCGGDTLFANMEAAYQGLDEDVKTEIDDLVAVHDWAGFRRGLKAQGVSEAKIEELNRKYPKAHHPLVRTHPVSGRKCLFINKIFTTGIDGMSHEESRPLLERLFLEAWKPEYQCRFRWRTNSVAFWDNRSTQHYAVSDYWPNERLMERVTIVGDKPV